MGDSGNIEDALYAVHSRLGVIEGKVNLVARAERAQLLALLKQTVSKDHLLGQIYLLLDGRRSQRDVGDALDRFGIKVSEATVSRRIGLMEREHGIAELAVAGGTKVYRKDPAMENVLNLTTNIRKWLSDEGAVLPVEPVKRHRNSSS